MGMVKPLGSVKKMKEFAHPKAVELLAEDFFWSCSDEDAPFGSDEGHDAFYQFQTWLDSNPDEEAIEYIKQLVEQNGGPEWNELEKINPLTIEKAFRGYVIDELDFEIIAVCFGQLILKGRIEPAIKQLGTIAIQRQLTEYALNDLTTSSKSRAERKEILSKELEMLEKYKD